MSLDGVPNHAEMQNTHKLEQALKRAKSDASTLRGNAILLGHYLDRRGNDCRQREEIKRLSWDDEQKYGHGHQMTRHHCSLCYAVGVKT